MGPENEDEPHESTRLGATGRGSGSGSNKAKPDVQTDALLEKRLQTQLYSRSCICFLTFFMVDCFSRHLTKL